MTTYDSSIGVEERDYRNVLAELKAFIFNWKRGFARQNTIQRISNLLTMADKCEEEGFGLRSTATGTTPITPIILLNECLFDGTPNGL